MPRSPEPDRHRNAFRAMRATWPTRPTDAPHRPGELGPQVASSGPQYALRQRITGGPVAGDPTNSKTRVIDRSPDRSSIVPFLPGGQRGAVAARNHPIGGSNQLVVIDGTQGAPGQTLSRPSDPSSQSGDGVVDPELMRTHPDFLSAVSALRRAHPSPESAYRHPLAENTFGDDEIAAALDVLVSGRLTIGERVTAFEQRFAREHGSAEAVFVNSGSSANLLILSALCRPNGAGQPALRPGDEVIVPAVTWPTTIWPISQVGAVPVLVDVSPETLNLTVEAVEAAISPATRAVFVTHLLGNPAPVDAIAELCGRRGLTLIEDSCEALGAEIAGQRVGTFGRLGTFSFFFSHHICTIEGGMITCQLPEDADRLRVLRAHGWSRQMSVPARTAIQAAHPEIDPRFLFIDTGYNLRPTELQAAIGLVQIGRLESFLAERRRLGTSWASRRDQHDIFMPTVFAPGASHFAFPIVLDPSSGHRRADLIAFLENAGIETRPLVAGNLARQPAMKNVPHRIAGALEGADLLHEAAMYVGLPCLGTADESALPDALDAFAGIALQEAGHR